MLMQRDRNKTVTQLVVLVPCQPEEQDGVATFLTELASPQPVRVVVDADFSAGTRQMKQAISAMFDYEGERFKAVLGLVSALQTRDGLAIANARNSVMKALTMIREGDKKLGVMPAREDDLEFGRILISVFGLAPGQEKQAIARWNGYCLGPKAEKDHKWLLSQLVSNALDSARLVLWWSGKRFQPAIYCPNPKTAIYTFLLMKIAAGQGWGVCPYCGQFFIQKRSDQSYCTIAHREAHRVSRWRAGQSTKLRKKGAKHGTHKTR
jgi:hypothetical protein